MIINKPTDDATLNIVLDTLQKNKQAIVFVNTKRSAEKAAEDISRKIKDTELAELEQDVLNALTRPTKQCERLAKCVKRGIAFHHSGLCASQRELIEDNFRKNKIRIICCTPTLAAGLSMPAYRTIIRDLKRYSNFGMDWIPVLEYLQMCGRAGRPEYDTKGEAIAIAKTDGERDEIHERYINGEPEDIYSKLAVEPVLRTYLLSLISTQFVRDKEQILSFFSKTFWAYQYKDMSRLNAIIEKMLDLLEEFEFIKVHRVDKELSGFVSANDIRNIKDGKNIDKITKISPTLIGKRVSELYLDPITADRIITSLRKAKATTTKELSYLQLVSNSLEMMPLLRVKTSEYDDVQSALIKYEPYLLESPPSIYDSDYDFYLAGLKTALMLNEWAEECDESYLLDKYDVRPGELYVKIENADWLLYSAEELAKLLGFQTLIKDIVKLRFRLKYGVKEELLPLLQLKQIGRVRARRLFKHKLHTLGDLRKADLATLSQIIGAKTAAYVKEQLDQTVDKVKENKRKGQINLDDYGNEIKGN